jgi:hypothetical protein
MRWMRERMGRFGGWPGCWSHVVGAPKYRRSRWSVVLLLALAFVCTFCYLYRKQTRTAELTGTRNQECVMCYVPPPSRPTDLVGVA